MSIYTSTARSVAEAHPRGLGDTEVRRVLCGGENHEMSHPKGSRNVYEILQDVSLRLLEVGSCIGLHHLPQIRL